MRDNFYHWLTVAIAFAVFFGASLARFVQGGPELYNVIAGGAITMLAAFGAISSYRRDCGGSSAAEKKEK